MIEFLAVLLIFGLGVFAGWLVTDWHYDRKLEPLLKALTDTLDDAATNQYKAPSPKD